MRRKRLLPVAGQSVGLVFVDIAIVRVRQFSAISGEPMLTAGISLVLIFCLFQTRVSSLNAVTETFLVFLIRFTQWHTYVRLFPSADNSTSLVK